MEQLMAAPRALFLLSQQLAAKQLLLGSCASTHMVTPAEALLLCSGASQRSSQHLTNLGGQYRQYGRLQQGVSQLQLPQHDRLQVLASSNSSIMSSYCCPHMARPYSAATSTPARAESSSRPSAGTTASPIAVGVSSDSSSSNSSSRKAGDAHAEPSPDIPPGAAAAATATGRTAAKATNAITKTVSRLLKLLQQTSVLQAAELQLSSTWQSHSTAISTVAAAAATAGLYHLMYAAAGRVVDVSSTEAVVACAAAAASAVGGAGLYIRSGLVLDPERVYQVAMRKVTRHAGLQEVMGTPLAGSAMRVQLITRGSYFIQETLLPRRRAPRIHMLFPLSGPLKSGVVSLEAKKLPNRKYAFRNLSVELPSATRKGAAARAAAAEVSQQLGAIGGSPGPGAAIPDSSGSSSSDAGFDTNRQVDTARVYIVGGPGHDNSRSSSSSSSVSAAEGSSTVSRSTSSTHAAADSRKHTVPSAQVLLEQLKHPLMLALQQNTVVYETEDELADLEGYDMALDPDQLTVWDRTKLGIAAVARGSVHYGKVAGCKVVGWMRRSLAAARAAAKKQEASRAAAAATAAAKAGERPGPASGVPSDAAVPEGLSAGAANSFDPAVASSAAAVVIQEATAAAKQGDQLQGPTLKEHSLLEAQEAAAKAALQKAAEETAASEDSSKSHGSHESNVNSAGSGPQAGSSRQP